MTVDYTNIVDIIKDVVSSMKVPVFGSSPVVYHSINFEPGNAEQILSSLRRKDGTTYSSFKYPLIATVMPISERNDGGLYDVTFQRIIFAYYTKNSNDDSVIKKYDSDNIYKTILYPMFYEFIKRLANSTRTLIGDPDMYEYIKRDIPSQQISDIVTDFVDIIEVQNLKAKIFSKIKTC